MKKTGGDVAAFLDTVTPAKRRRDAAALLALVQEATGREPELWGAIVGFGSCHYRYPTGSEGDSPIIGFAPRKNASTVYLLDGIAAHADELAVLGTHTTGAGCLYLSDLDAVDGAVLRRIVSRSYERVVAGDLGSTQITVTD